MSGPRHAPLALSLLLACLAPAIARGQAPSSEAAQAPDSGAPAPEPAEPEASAPTPASESPAGAAPPSQSEAQSAEPAAPGVEIHEQSADEVPPVEHVLAEDVEDPGAVDASFFDDLQEEEEDEGPSQPACIGEDCLDFAFMKTGHGTLLGVSLGLSAASMPGDDPIHASQLLSYRADLLRSRGLYASHLRLHGALGLGSAGTEGRLDLTYAHGLRLALTRTTGPVLRVGPAVMLATHDALHLASIEPLRATLALQRLEGERHLEFGAFLSPVGAGRYRVRRGGTSLGGTLAVGTFVSARLGRWSAEGAASVLHPAFTGAQLGLVRAAGCLWPGSFAICADLFVIQGRVPIRRSEPASVRSFFVGITTGLTP